MPLGTWWSTSTTNERDLPRISADRGYEINQMAWEHFATPVGAEFAQSYLAGRRGIDLVALRPSSGGAPIVGYAATGWTSLVSRLNDQGVSDQGVSDDELLVTDLAQFTRMGRLVDAYRGRIIIPVTNRAGQVSGFVGRDVTGDNRAPKYRNPTRTATFNRSTILHRRPTTSWRPTRTSSSSRASSTRWPSPRRPHGADRWTGSRRAPPAGWAPPTSRYAGSSPSTRDHR
jgi:hypothetical protein